MERRDRALANIVLGIDAKLLYLLGDPQDPVQVWQLLCNQFQKKTWSNKLALKRKLYGRKLKDQESVQAHLKSMVEIFDELAVIGDAIEEEDKVVHILTSLPESYGMLVTALEASVEVPKLELVTEKILNEERKLKEKCNSSGGPSNPSDCALFVSKPKTCFYCGELGHIKRFCPELRKKNEEQEQKKEQAIANFSYHGKFSNKKQADSDSETECIALISETKIKKKWIVDSAATHHMCNDKNDMKDLQRLRYPQNVKVGNGEYVQSNYKGTVKLVVESGRTTRKVKLCDVLLVPNMKYNLFSVSKAAELGKKVEFTRSGCRIVDISSGEMVVSASKVGKLYHLDCLDRRDQSQIQKTRVTPRKEMEIALLSVKENNFKEEMMRRLNSMEKDKINLELRLDKFEEENRELRQDKFEEKNRNVSYLFKEDVCQNHANGDLMNFLHQNKGDKFCFESDSDGEESDMLQDDYEGHQAVSRNEVEESSDAEGIFEESFEEKFQESFEQSFKDSFEESDIECTSEEDESVESQQKENRMQEDSDTEDRNSECEPTSSTMPRIMLELLTPSVVPTELSSSPMSDNIPGSVKDSTSSRGLRSRIRVLKKRFSKLVGRSAGSSNRK